MKATIEVATRAEGDAVRAALADKEVRAFVLVAGALLALQSDRARGRVLRFVSDNLAEHAESAEHNGSRPDSVVL